MFTNPYQARVDGLVSADVVELLRHGPLGPAIGLVDPVPPGHDADVIADLPEIPGIDLEPAVARQAPADAEFVIDEVTGGWLKAPMRPWKSQVRGCCVKKTRNASCCTRR